MGGLPKEYVPEVGPMHVPAGDYRPYDATMSPPMPARPVGPTGGRGAFGPADMSEPDAMNAEGLIDEDFLAVQSKLALGQFGGPSVIPEGCDPRVRPPLQGYAGPEMSEFDQDLGAHLLEIHMAVERMRAEPIADVASGLPNEALHGHEIMMGQPAVTDPAGGALDPSRYEPQDFFARQVEMIERQFTGPDLPHHDFAGIDALVAAQDTLFRSPVDPTDQPTLGQPAGSRPSR